MERTAKKVRRRRFFRRLLGVVLAVGLLVGGTFAWRETDQQLTEEYTRVMPLDEYMVTVAQTKAGNGIIAVNLMDDERRAATVKINYNYQNVDGGTKKILEIKVMTTVLPQYLEGDEANKVKMLRTMFRGTIIDGEWSSKESWHEMYSDLRVQEPQYAIWDEIVVVSDNERKVIYTRGDAIPYCSEEMEAYYEAYHEAQPAGKSYPEWRVDLVKLLDKVPELQWESDEDRYKWLYVCENGDLKFDAVYTEVFQQRSGCWSVIHNSIQSGSPCFSPEIEFCYTEDGTGAYLQFRLVYKGMESDEWDWAYVGTWGNCFDEVWSIPNYDSEARENVPILWVEVLSGNESRVIWRQGDRTKTQQEVDEYLAQFGYR